MATITVQQVFPKSLNESQLRIQKPDLQYLRNCFQTKTHTEFCIASPFMVFKNLKKSKCPSVEGSVSKQGESMWGKQYKSPQNIPLWHKDYFKKQQTQENLQKLSRKCPFVSQVYICKGKLHLWGVPRTEGLNLKNSYQRRRHRLKSA